MVSLSALTPPEDVQHKEDVTSAFVGEKLVGKGTVFISQSILLWVNEDGQGFKLDYPSINMHGVSRDHSKFPNDCLLLMVQGKLPAPPEPQMNGHASMETDHAADSGSSDEGEDDDLAFTEIRFVPSNSQSLDTMFKAMSECQALNPDPNDECYDEEDEDYEEAEDGCYEDDGTGEAPPPDEGIDPGTFTAVGAEDKFYTDETGLEHLSATGRANLARFEAMLSSQQSSSTTQDGGMPGVEGGGDAPMGDQDEPVVGGLQGTTATAPTDQNSMETGQFEDAEPHQ